MFNVYKPDREYFCSHHENCYWEKWFLKNFLPPLSVQVITVWHILPSNVGKKKGGGTTEMFLEVFYYLRSQ